MEINGSQNIDAPRQRVWDALNDPVILKECLPGCESVERVSPEEFRVILCAAIGPLRARFNGTLCMTDAQPPESCLMSFEGQGGVVGFGKGTSSVSLAEAADGTMLSYTTNAQVGGKLAQVGSRLIDSVARKMADDFFAALRRQIVPVPQVVEVATVEETEAAQSPDATNAAPAEKAVSSQATAGRAPDVSNPPFETAAVVVPAWWLAIAAAIGAAASIAGVLAAR
jgi:carbon monoxide dehydrogenase subunit G